MRARFILWLFVFVALIPVGRAQEKRSSDPASLIARVDRLFDRWDKPDSPGCALGVYRDGRVIYKRAYGIADLDHDIPLTTRSVFHVASVSKQFTAAAVTLLALEGKLSLDDNVRTYIPELPDFGHRITIQHLIHHTSGLRDQWSLLGLAGWRYSLDLITDDDVLQMMSRQRELNFTPGDRHVYCNTGYTLLATIVSRVSKMSFREYTTTRFFEPLGMTSTHFRDDHAEVVKNQAYGYVSAGDKFRLSVTNFDTVGATSLLTTVEDLARWDANFEEKKVGGDGLQEVMSRRGALNNGEKLNYAFGLVFDSHRGLPTVGHGGSDAGYRSDFVRFPEQHLGVACLCNLASINPGELTRHVAEIFLADAIPPGPSPTTTNGSDGNGDNEISVSEQELATYAGLYWSHDEENGRKIVFTDGSLRAVFGTAQHEMKPAGDRAFVLRTGPPLRLQFDEGSSPGRRRLVITPIDGGTPQTLEGVETFAPTPAQLSEFAGTYRSDEMDALYRFVIEKGALVLKRLRSSPARLEPALTDVFTGQPGTVRFLRDKRGKVTGFVINAGRVRNVRFWKDEGTGRRS